MFVYPQKIFLQVGKTQMVMGEGSSTLLIVPEENCWPIAHHWQTL